MVKVKDLALADSWAAKKKGTSGQCKAGRHQDKAHSKSRQKHRRQQGSQLGELNTCGAVQNILYIHKAKLNL
jgi:hypothetical protein